MGNNSMHEYARWCAALPQGGLLAELRAIEGRRSEIEERFAIDLSFGTAGLRGILGAGTNRMNVYTVARATQGLAATLHQQGGGAVAVSYDSRINSRLFAETVAGTLAANGIKAWIYPTLTPVPMLSFAVRQLGCAAGVMITASHNPAKYNGYKVFGADGCQLSTETALAVEEIIDGLDIFADVKRMPFDQAVARGIAEFIPDEVAQAYYRAVEEQSPRPGVLARTDLSVVYTPLNGAGNLPVRRVLADMGAARVAVVPQQEMPDGSFPTCPSPNPEYREALAMGLALAEETGADLVLATDPDADRVGIACKTDRGYRLFTGNEVGVLLTDYLLAARKENDTLPQRGIVVRSVVSTAMADAVAADYGVETVQVLTGFKYIGEQIALLEKKEEAHRFLLGFEESYGYLAGTYVRDKDGVVASMLICEMAAYYKEQGLTLAGRLEQLSQRYGVYLHKVDSFGFDGLAGMEKMAAIMAALRGDVPAEIGGRNVLFYSDYAARTRYDTTVGKGTPIDLPAADMLMYELEGGGSLVVRPSGTEPKIKAYYTAIGTDEEAARQALAGLQAFARGRIGE